MAKIAYTHVSELVEERADLTTFNNLLRRSGVIKDVDRGGPYTILAPTNDAFDRLPEGALGALVDDSERFRQVIDHHIVDGLYPTASAFEPTYWPTLRGGSISLMPAENTLVVGSAQVIERDLPADNGMVHIIDTVLITE
jgi:uncharacterized surface protein with fasciclin (FAS1) repeats